MKKTWMITTVCLIFLSVLIGFAVKFLREDDRPKVVVVLKSLNAEYWEIFDEGVKKGFEDFNIDGRVLAPDSEYRITQQTNILKDVLKQNPDALIVATSHPSAVIPILTEYHKKHIPVLIADTDVGWKDQTSYIGTNNPLLGKVGGELLASMLYPGDQVALISNESASGRVARERIQGAKEALETVGIEIVKEQQRGGDFGNGNSVMETLLQNHPDIKGVYATTDNLALDALKVIEEKGLEIPVVGADGVTKMMEYIESGILNATVAQNPYDMGYISVEQALKAIKGENVEKRVDSGVDIITEDNAQDKLEFLEKTLN
ncbi:sugar ABC transporter substrate-binding protein [Priestia abyssalis]|uniref:sugar ABC transporter substrate-binding protein n=1 Tax=Priestia abyssalis TaxID=1221450 RepID=UPI00099577C8|nr:sugar ABC transporter substrate-binding protein [Priestia abyssalis]